MKDSSKVISFSEFLENIFQQADIVALGETVHAKHLDIFKEFDHLSKKVKNSLSGVFLEFPNNLQSSVNHYLKTGKFNSNLLNFLKGAAKEGKDFQKMYRSIFGFARKLNILVICTDSSKAPNGEYQKRYHQNPTWFMKGKSRDEDMANIIKKQYRQREGKWFFIAHLGHAGYEITYDNHVPAGKILKRELQDKYYCIGLVKQEAKKNTFRSTAKMADAFLII
ncbi:MAG: erythromycin esterase family protein [Candidatus Shapirobacteria bacterium]